MHPPRLCIPGTDLGHNPGTVGSLRFLTILSIRAVRLHPGGLDDCTCLYFVVHAGFALSGRLAIHVFYLGAESGSHLRITARIVRSSGLRHAG